jgi:hypothetical protein
LVEEPRLEAADGNPRREAKGHVSRYGRRNIIGYIGW